MHSLTDVEFDLHQYLSLGPNLTGSKIGLLSSENSVRHYQTEAPRPLYNESRTSGYCNSPRPNLPPKVAFAYT
ncbi:hypothetical protein EVAR_73685_1 [Eumeta japonica]|uniref:Uncharacterized protein n=1 Tax=Eumeta variegata TaxID=151549 RepID=A0A4C1TQ95_EUMVA|nr:hypothetical protein EVAR_73685_1 [Eumeta japonica]